MHKVLTLLFGIVFRVPVAANSQNGLGALLNRYHIRQSHTGLFTRLIRIFVARKNQIYVHLKQLEPLIGRSAKAHLLGNLLLYFVQHSHRLAKVYISIEPSHLKLTNLIRCFAHNMSDALCCS